MLKHRKIRMFWRAWGGLIKLALLFATLILLASCTTNTSGDYCLLYRPIYADYSFDTPETIRQIDDNNVVYDTLCER